MPYRKVPCMAFSVWAECNKTTLRNTKQKPSLTKRPNASTTDDTVCDAGRNRRL